MTLLRAPERIVYLGGDSYPEDADIERTVCSALDVITGVAVRRQAALIAQWRGAGDWRVIDSRVAQLREHIAAGDPATTVLVGRSSGARVVTQVAATTPVAAVVCLSYPFENPAIGPEADRTAHLSALSTPTLMIQGAGDVYGGANVAHRYVLSAAVEVAVIDSSHEMRLSDDAWRTVATRIALFLGQHIRLRTTRP